MLQPPLVGPRLGSGVVRADLSAASALPNARLLPDSDVSASEQRLGPWVLEQTIAEGSTASVYLARPAEQPARDQSARYALKLLHSRWQEDRGTIARMRAEATVGQCVSHRHIVSIISAHLHEPPHYVLMPFFEGGNVSGLISKDSPLETPFALWIVRQAAEALEAFHAFGYMHGDVKPANLLIAKNGHVLLIDLSCARRLEDEPTLEAPPLLGTPNYIAPECFCGSAGDSRSDLYSLGMSLFELLTGRLPISTNDLATLATFKRQGAIPNVRVFRPSLSNEVADLVRQLTARDPLRRPQHAREVVQQLVRLEISSLKQRIRA